MGILDPKPLTQVAAAATYAPLSGSANYAPASGSPNYESGITTTLYVHSSGSDSNHGKTWAKAKATVGGALSALAGTAGLIQVGAGTITETTGWGTIPAGTVIRGSGRYTTTVNRSFNGDLATMGNGVKISDLTIAGLGNTGRALIFAGTDGNQTLTDVSIQNFDGFCLDFAVAAGSGFRATNLEAYRTAAGSGTGRYAINIADTQQLSAVPRSFVALTTAGQCAINFGGCNDTLVTNSFIADVRFTADSRGVNIVASRIANQPSLTVNGHNNSIVGCDLNPQITIASGADAITLGPGSFNQLPVIDSSGNARNNVTHWQITYACTLTSGGTAPSLGNGTITALYSRSGATVTVNVEFTIGSTTTLGTGGLRFSLPFARSTGTVTSIGSAVCTGGATNYTATVRIPGAVGYCELIRDTSGAVTFNSPATFATGDTIRFTGTYMV